MGYEGQTCRIQETNMQEDTGGRRIIHDDYLVNFNFGEITWHKDVLLEIIELFFYGHLEVGNCFYRLRVLSW